MALLTVEQDVRDGFVVVCVRGEVDSGSVQHLTEKLCAAVDVAGRQDSRTLILEMDDITYFGSAGLNALLSCCDAAAGKGVAVRVVATTAEVVRPIEVTRTDRVLRLFATRDDALAWTEEPQ